MRDCMALQALVAGSLAVMSVGGARAESVDSDCCGALYYHVRHDGAVTGEYPKQNGHIDGRVSPDGTATGIWIQPRSDHPCLRPQYGTYAWGRFVIRNIGDPDMSGEWGYCDEVPNRGWGFH